MIILFANNPVVIVDEAIFEPAIVPFAIFELVIVVLAIFVPVIVELVILLFTNKAAVGTPEPLYVYNILALPTTVFKSAIAILFDSASLLYAIAAVALIFISPNVPVLKEPVRLYYHT